MLFKKGYKEITKQRHRKKGKLRKRKERKTEIIQYMNTYLPKYMSSHLRIPSFRMDITKELPSKREIFYNYISL